MSIKKSIKSVLFFFLLPFCTLLNAQTPITVCPQISFFSSMTRGYYFTALTNFTICGLYVEDDMSTAAQSVAIVKFNGGVPPTTWPTTTNSFVTLFQSLNYGPNTMIPVPSITINTGDVIGIYGSRGAAVNSYGAMNCVVTINSIPHTLHRSGMQYNLGTQPGMHDIWTEAADIGRVTMYTNCCPPPPAIPTITGNTTICLGDTLTYSCAAQPYATNYTWTVPTGDSIISGQGTTSITVAWNGTGGNLCVDWTDTCTTSPQTCINVTISPPPQPNFTVTPDCPGMATQFNNTTSNLNNNTYQWDFGDGVGTSTAQSPTYTYDSGGVYVVQLIATSATGCIDTVMLNDTIPYLPIANFSSNNACFGDSTCFIDSSTVQNSTITGWTWSWGDGSPTGNTQNPCHLFTAAGTYTVILIPVSAEGCTAASPAVQQVTVGAASTVSFTVNNVCQYDAAVFNNTSSGNVSNLWDFGDGNTSTVVNPTHQYAASGTYNVKLTTTASAGCQVDTTISVVIYPVPTADFNFTNVCDGIAMNFTDNSTIGGGGSISGWAWNFGNGGTSTQQNPSYTYSNAGNYNVTLIVNTAYNCNDTDIQQVEIYPNPTVDFSTTPVCVGIPVNFNDQSTVGSGNLNTWNWSFGDTPPGTSYQQNPTYTYNNSGTFNVILIVSTNNGCKDTITKPMTVNPNPVADFFSKNNKGCTPWCVNFTDSSNISLGTINQWAWDFGNGNTGNGQSVSACYTNTGLGVNNYTITLTVTSDKGCTNTETKNNYVRIYPQPIANFTMDPNPGDIWHNKIHFEDESQGASVWAWNFGDGMGVSTSENPIYIYSDTGTYVVTLNVANQWGCTDSTYNLLRINPKFGIFIPNAFTPNYHDGNNDYFSVKGFGIKNIDMKIFNRWGNLIFSESSMNPKWDGKYENNLVAPGVYVYKVIVKDQLNHDHTYIGSVSVMR